MTADNRGSQAPDLDGQHHVEARVFEEQRSHLRSVAYRMLGSLNEADDAVQEAWLRLSRAETGDVRDMRAWLTTVVSRVCLDMLRSRATRREESLDVHVPDPVVTRVDDDPAEHALLADSVGIALLVVLDTLPPSERLAFVLHDVFAVPFDEIGAILDRSTGAAKQLASRARHRLRTASAHPAPVSAAVSDLTRQWRVVDAFLAASRQGDFEGLLAILDPDVVLRADTGDGPFGPPVLIRGAREFIARSQQFSSLRRFARPVLVNGGPGFLVVRNGEPVALLAATIHGDKITEMNILADPVRLRQLDLDGLVAP